uniref:Uncharacterized protein n=1 Tax=uncultured marine virus TaxID=186617 RepID=A0A0F7L6K2_9VIRU|nr:hypothetical protein [uncultured marine virus]
MRGVPDATLSTRVAPRAHIRRLRIIGTRGRPRRERHHADDTAAAVQHLRDGIGPPGRRRQCGRLDDLDRRRGHAMACDKQGPCAGVHDDAHRTTEPLPANRPRLTVNPGIGQPQGVPVGGWPGVLIDHRRRWWEQRPVLHDVALEGERYRLAEGAVFGSVQQPNEQPATAFPSRTAHPLAQFPIGCSEVVTSRILRGKVGGRVDQLQRLTPEAGGQVERHGLRPLHLGHEASAHLNQRAVVSNDAQGVRRVVHVAATELQPEHGVDVRVSQVAWSQPHYCSCSMRTVAMRQISPARESPMMFSSPTGPRMRP